MARVKHKFQRLVFNPANRMLIHFLDELQKWAKVSFEAAARAIIDILIIAEMTPQLKKLIIQAHLENGTYEHIVSCLENELDLNGLEAPDQLHVDNLTQ